MKLGDQVVRSLRQRVTVLPFHADWIRATFANDIQISAMSCPRGSAKSWCVGQLAALGLRPRSPLFQPGIETLVVSASLEQSRIILGFVREALDDDDYYYRWLDSGQRLAVTHKATGTKLRVLSSSGSGAWVVAVLHHLRRRTRKLRGPRRRADVRRAPAVPGQTPWSAPGDDRYSCAGRGRVLVAFFSGWGIRTGNSCDGAHGARFGALGRMVDDQEGEPSRHAQRGPAQDDPARTRRCAAG